MRKFFKRLWKNIIVSMHKSHQRRVEAIIAARYPKNVEDVEFWIRHQERYKSM